MKPIMQKRFMAIGDLAEGKFNTAVGLPNHLGKPLTPGVVGGLESQSRTGELIYLPSLVLMFKDYLARTS